MFGWGSILLLRIINQRHKLINNRYLLISDKSVRVWISKQDMKLCLKVNKRQRKCYVNCVSGTSEERVCRRPKIYNDGSFQSKWSVSESYQSVSSQQSGTEQRARCQGASAGRQVTDGLRSGPLSVFRRKRTNNEVSF